MDNSLNEIWKERPEIIRSYYEKIHIHQRLCEEVKYILENKIKSSNIEIGHLNFRTKSLASFCEKIGRKSYENPIEDITDLSGVRIVFLYTSDRIKLEKIIEEEFDIHERVDKLLDQGVEKFGYGALHYIISLKEQHAGVRYDDLKEVRCEIQIRTILQDAWAIVAHHLSYKHEEAVPNELKRKLNSLSALFENVDDQFESINNARLNYQTKVKDSFSADSEQNLDIEINLDNLIGYMSWRFPERDTDSKESASELLEELNTFGYKTLKSIDNVVNRSWQAVLASEERYPPQNEDDTETTIYVGVGLIRKALEFCDSSYFDFKNKRYSRLRSEISDFLHLVNKGH